MEPTIREYIDSKGISPYRQWLNDLDKGARARIQARIFRFELGNLGDHKSVGRGVWEARIPFGPGYRVYFGKDGNELILLLLGGDKSTQRKDIEKAQECWAEYLEAKADGKKN